LLAWGFVVNNLLFGLAPQWAVPARPSLGALMGFRQHHPLGPGPGAIILIAWAVAVAVVGIALSIRQDIN